MSVAGIDFGNHSSYVSIVKTGGVETIDNDFSYRATPTSVSFTNLQRYTGNNSSSQNVTNFRNTFSSFRNLIGLQYDDAIAQKELSLSRSNFIKMEDGSIGIETNYLGEVRKFSIMQLVGMMATELKNTALRHLPSLTEIVFSVPSYFSETQRRSYLAALGIASIQPSALISEPAAVAYTYVLFKTDLPDEKDPPRYVAFVDVGYSSTQAYVVAFHKSSVRILTSVGSPTIGGRNFDKLLFQKFCEDFRAKHKKDVLSNRKACIKLIVECEKIKKSVNAISSDIPLRLECFMDDIDFYSSTSREELNKLAEPLYGEFRELLSSVLTKSGITLNDIHSVEAIGGSSRIIGIRKIISEVFGKDVSTTLNADEAVSRGCAIQAALLSATIRIRPIVLKDSSQSEYVVVYQNKNNETKELKIIKFDEPVPNSKEILFPPLNDFSFHIREITHFGNSHVAFCRSFGKTVESCNADKLVFQLDITSAGILSVTKAYFLENKKTTEQVQPESLDNSKSPETEQSIKIVKTAHDLNFEFNFINNCYSHVSEYHQIEQDMIKRIELEKERSMNKNALEEYIYSSRETIGSIDQQYTTPEEVANIYSVLSACEDWLNDDDDSTASEIYSSKLSECQNLVLPVKLRYEAYQRLTASLQDMECSLMKYRKNMDLFQQDTTKYSHLTDTEIKEYQDKIKACDTFCIETGNLIKNHPKNKLPAINSEKVEDKHFKLRSVCDRIINIANNPPLPQKEVPPSINKDEQTTSGQAPSSESNQPAMEKDE